MSSSLPEMKRTATESSLTTTTTTEQQPRRPSPPAIEQQQQQHHQALTFSAGGLAGGLRRAISQVSLLVAKTTTSSEAAWRDEFQRYRQTRFSSRRVRKRVVFKHGDCNVVQGNVAKRRRRYLQDIFTTLVDAQWRWTLLVFAMTFLLSWLGFALVWWLVVYAHGDLEPRPAAASGDEGSANNSTNFVPCVEDIHGFTSCFLFSVETQHTIGYGSKHTTEECPEAIFIMCIQSMTGVILQAFMVGIVFAKLSRPKKRTQTLLFSRNAVICQRDGQACLMFRVGDMRKSHIIEAHVRAQMIKRKVTREGELLPFFQTELRVGGDGDEDKIFFIWPTTIVHKIDQSSPLYHLSASDMLRERFEIIVMLEGVIESTGMTTQARSSYLPSEILWGHRFEHIITFRKETGEYEVDYTLFNNTYEVDTPLCSAAELDHMRALHRAKGERSSSATFAQYRIDSSSSLSTASNSGSSCASSVGGLHMRLQHQHYQHGATPPTPIPVTVTGPDEPNSRRGSQVDPLTRSRLATFYTLDEATEAPEEDPVVLAVQRIVPTLQRQHSEEGDELPTILCPPLFEPGQIVEDPGMVRIPIDSMPENPVLATVGPTREERPVMRGTLTHSSSLPEDSSNAHEKKKTTSFQLVAPEVDNHSAKCSRPSEIV
ncbi:inward rectifier potassium channel 4-like isoform X1 [Trichogramma pretiosum]|uniref:inward rectifier potassium channel 4-like isoform X1 n=1 Tax=Trichogramma pretiosum TaxID=7493 RepID=UPI0006C94BF1|nr:inward rectifier potassium channel 4-like isoform X1 [Trichogramma pretiosum]XP_014233972.1 inward rectifier potassium channel 4-like isoform X1 [Trichogramma pretiosum]